MTVVDFLITLLSSLAALIALGTKLYSTFKALINERKYSDIFDTVIAAIESAEAMLELSGADKKKYVMAKADECAKALGIKDFDSERISALIETIIGITKKVNTN